MSLSIEKATAVHQVVIFRKQSVAIECGRRDTQHAVCSLTVGRTVHCLTSTVLQATNACRVWHVRPTETTVAPSPPHPRRLGSFVQRQLSMWRTGPDWRSSRSHLSTVLTFSRKLITPTRHLSSDLADRWTDCRCAVVYIGTRRPAGRRVTISALSMRRIRRYTCDCAAVDCMNATTSLPPAQNYHHQLTMSPRLAGRSRRGTVQMTTENSINTCA